MSVPPDSRQKCRAALYGFGQTASLGAIARVAGLWARQLPDGGPPAARGQPDGNPAAARSRPPDAGRYH